MVRVERWSAQSPVRNLGSQDGPAATEDRTGDCADYFSAQGTVRTTFPHRGLCGLLFRTGDCAVYFFAQRTVRTTFSFRYFAEFLMVLPMQQDGPENQEPAQRTVRTTTFSFYDPALPVSRTHGHLPHWEQERGTYFITWRLADSIARQTWETWRESRSAWLRMHRIDPGNPEWRRELENLPDEARQDFRRFATALEDELDSGHGACLLRNPGVAAIMAGALKHWDGDRYLLGDFVIMPNHVHLLVGGLSRGSMVTQVTSWKKWTAIQINKAMGAKGRLWQDESFDHLVRSETAFQRFRRYIAANPVKGNLKAGEHILWQRPD